MSTFAPLRNVLKVWLVLAGICGILALIGYGIGDVRVLSTFVFCGVLLGIAAYVSLDRIVLGMLRARELSAREAPDFHATVERLAVRAGVAKPKVYLIEKGPPLALAAGRGANSSTIVATEALVRLPVPAEVEAVLAHEFAHIVRRDVIVQTTAVVISTAIVETSRIGGFFERSLLFVLGPVASAFVHLLLSTKREFQADELAAQFCDSPHGLADALIRLEQAAELLEFTASTTTEPLYTINPFLEEGVAALFVTHPPVSDRVQRLRALDPDWRDKLRAA
jgi:heat shock protein HtpX